jgi:chromosome partitioning protein
MRWVTMSKQMNVWPDRLEAESCLDPNRIYKMALERQFEGKIVFIDIEGTTNENLFAGLYCADIVLIPLQTTQDDVVAGMQLALNHIPVVEEDQKRKLPALIVINQHDLVTGRAKAHEPLREILRESGVALSSQPIARRAAYQSIGAAGTLQTAAKSDPKAIAEMETLLGELLTLYRSTAKEALL